MGLASGKLFLNIILELTPGNKWIRTTISIQTEGPIFANRMRQGCRIRAYRDVFTACLEKWDRRSRIDEFVRFPEGNSKMEIIQV